MNEWLGARTHCHGEGEELYFNLLKNRRYMNTRIYIYMYIYRVSQEECAKLRESVPYVKVYRYNPKHLCPYLNGYGDNGQRSLKL